MNTVTPKTQGMSLVELLVVVAIICILSAIAVFSYSSYVKRGRRMNAVNSLLSISLAEERYRSSNALYGTLAQVWGGVSTTTGGYYTVAISGVGATGYTITATAQGTQTSDASNGTSCTPLTFVMASGTVTKTPAACWPT